LFRGRVDKIEWNKDRAQTTLSGRGVSYKLDTSEIALTVTNQLAHNAVADFWSNTAFSATVTTPSIDNTTTNTVAQEADTTAEFADLIETFETEPLEVTSDSITTLQSCFTVEAENQSTSGTPNNSDGSFSNGEAITMLDAGDSVTQTFTPDYEIPIDEFNTFIRIETTTSANPIDVSLNGEFLGQFNFADGSLGWLDLANIGIDFTEFSEDSLSAATSYSLKFEVASGGNDATLFDVLAPLDSRYNYTFDNDNGGSGGYLDGPELYPDSITKVFDRATTSWNITDSTLTTTWDSTDNNQKIQLRLNDQTWFPNDGSENNTSSITTAFGSEVGSTIQGRATFSRYGSRTNATPQTGFNGQTLSDWEITFDGNDIPVITSETFEGTEFQVSQDLHNRAEMRFTLLHSANSLDVESYKAGDVIKSLPTFAELNRTIREDVENYANDITIRGQRVNGERLSHNVSDSTAISNFGTQHFDRIDPSLETEEAVKIEARNTLKEKLREAKTKGDLEIVPVDVAPGFSYANPFDSGDIPIEEVRYSTGANNLSGMLAFDFRVGDRIAADIGGLNRDARDTQRGF
jgi:hypothetical protein